MIETLGGPLQAGMFVEVFGARQWIAIRGADAANPAILLLHGPGAASSLLAPHFAPWERHFTVVHWDQPGAGATYAAASGPGEPLSLRWIARDGLRVAEMLRDALGGRRLVLLGWSGGSVLGLMMAKARPDLFCAYVGAGQFVHWRRQEALGYRLQLDQARAAGDLQGLAELEAIGPPPWADISADVIRGVRASALTAAEEVALKDLPAILAAPGRHRPEGLVPHDPRARSLAAYTELRAELKAWDARRLGLRYELPLVFLQGELDLYSVGSEVEAFAAAVEAPLAGVEPIAGAGHGAVLMVEPVLEVLRRRLAPLRDA